MRVLECGNCEELKTGVHAAVLGLAAICGLYNTAAWLARRQTHLGVNALLYGALILWEHQHVVHHLAEMNAHPPVSVPQAPVLVVDRAEPLKTAA